MTPVHLHCNAKVPTVGTTQSDYLLYPGNVFPGKEMLRESKQNVSTLRGGYDSRHGKTLCLCVYIKHNVLS